MEWTLTVPDSFLNPSSACYITGAPLPPGFPFSVNWTRLRVTGGRFFKGPGTVLSFVERADAGPIPPLDPPAAGDTTVVPPRPVTKHSVHWAVVSIAVPGLSIIAGTVHSTIIRPITRTITRLVSPATILTAVIPERPRVPDTVNGTWEIVATARILIFTLA